MAKKQKLIYTGDPPRTHVETHKRKFIWGIDDPVTWHWNSNYDDVLLVQYLLNKSGYLTEPLVLDGIFGRKTYRAIKKFQYEHKNSYVDGRIDPYKGSTVSTKSNTVYTILHLNDALLWTCSNYYNDISRDPDCPLELFYLGSSGAVS